MVGMKGGSVGICELDVIADDPRVADTNSMTLGMFVATIEF